MSLRAVLCCHVLMQLRQKLCWAYFDATDISPLIQTWQNLLSHQNEIAWRFGPRTAIRSDESHRPVCRLYAGTLSIRLRDQSISAWLPLFVSVASVGQRIREPSLQLDQHRPCPQPPQEEPVGGDGVAALWHTLWLQPQQQGAVSGPAGIPAGADAPAAGLQRHHLSHPGALLRGNSTDHALPEWPGGGRDHGGAALCICIIYLLVQVAFVQIKEKDILMGFCFSHLQLEQELDKHVEKLKVGCC